MRQFAVQSMPGRIVFGAGVARTALADELDRLDARRVLLVVAPGERELARDLCAPLGARVAATFTDVAPHVPLAVAQAARAVAADAGADAVLSVGGGSTTGTAKAVALTTGLPIVAVPTTYAGSEVTPVWGLTEGGRKSTGTDPVVAPRTVLYDPELTVGLPVELSVASGLNAVAHCVEAFWAPGANPVTDLSAAEGIRVLAAALPRLAADPADLDVRGELLYGAYLAGSAFAVAGSGLHHKICHALGGAYDLPHAHTHAAVLPYVMAFNAPAAPQAAHRIARALGVDGDPARALRDLSERLGLGGGLQELGMSREQIEPVLEHVTVPADNPRPVDRGALRAIVTAAWASDDISGDRAAREAEVTAEVVASFAGAQSPRYRELMQALVRHLHGFVREVRLTQAEWEQGIDFLTRAGHITTDTRQEFVLASDVLGLSMLTIAVNAPTEPGATESTVFGPFFVADAPYVELGGDVAGGAKGTPCWVSGNVRSTTGAPLADARIEVWEADEDGFYDVQYDDGHTAGRGWLRSGPDGEYRFWSVLPSAYPIPYDGPVGDLLDAAGRSPMRPAHLHFLVEAPGHTTLITHLFLADGPHLDSDAVFGVKDSLIVSHVEQPPGTAPDGREMTDPWMSIDFDLVLAPDSGSDNDEEQPL